jgi:hypothetical protein
LNVALRVKIPDSCADLCPAKVERILEKHFGDIYAAARELGVSGPDLRRLTWAKPGLLENALEELELVVIRAHGQLIEALDSDDPQRRQWAADKILSSWLARDHPFAPARRGISASVSEFRTITFRRGNSDGSDNEPATEVPKYSDGSDDDPVEGELSMPPGVD